MVRPGLRMFSQGPLWMVLLLLLSWSEAHNVIPGPNASADHEKAVYNIARRDENPETPDPEFEIKERVLNWLTKIDREGLPEDCHTFYDPIVHRNLSNLILSPIDCDADGAVKDFDFSGEVDYEGLPRGIGTLTIGSKSKQSTTKVCLKIQTLFTEELKTLTGNFKLGFPDGKIQVEWTNEIWGEVFFSEGIPHGGYKIVVQSDSPQRVTALGHLNNGNTNSSCWITTDDEIRFGNCTEPFVFDKTTVTAVIARSLKQDSVGVIGAVRDKMLSPAYDVFLKTLEGNRNCTRDLLFARFAHPFQYDLETQERRFKGFHLPEVLCPQGQEEVVGRQEAAAAFRTYLKRLTMELFLGQFVDESTFEPKRARRLLTKVEETEHNRYEAILQIFEPIAIEFRYFGPRDEEDNFHGYGEIQILQKKVCYRGKCAFPPYFCIHGYFDHGVLQGPVSLHHSSRTESTTTVVKDGIIHGLLGTFGLVPLLPHVRNPEMMKSSAELYAHNGMGTLIPFLNGKPVGKILRGTVCNPKQPGFLYGVPDKNSQNVSGTDAAWLYPFYESALIGGFESNRMESGRYAHLKSFRCNEHHFPEFTFTQPEGPAFFFDPPTNETITSQPMLQDPFEAELVEVRESQVPGAGEGVYALKAIQKGQFFAMYAGIQVNKEQIVHLERNYCIANLNGSNPCDKYSIGTYMGATIYLPTPWNRRDHNRATSAAKINNAFEPDVTSRFVDMEHPRFGLIMGADAWRDITPGSEVLINYGYQYEDLDQALAQGGNHKWYFEQLKAHNEKLADQKADAPPDLPNLPPKSEL